MQGNDVVSNSRAFSELDYMDPVEESWMWSWIKGNKKWHSWNRCKGKHWSFVLCARENNGVRPSNNGVMHNGCDFHETILRYCRLKIFEIPLRCVLFHFNCFSYSMTKIKTNIVVGSGFESARTSQSDSSILESLTFTHTFVKIRISGYLVGLHA